MVDRGAGSFRNNEAYRRECVGVKLCGQDSTSNSSEEPSVNPFFVGQQKDLHPMSFLRGV